MKLEKWKNKWKEWSNLRKWQIWKLKLIDARLYFVSIFVGLLTGLVAVPYHYLLWYFFDVRKTFFTAHYPWYWHVLLFFPKRWAKEDLERTKRTVDASANLAKELKKLDESTTSKPTNQ